MTKTKIKTVILKIMLILMLVVQTFSINVFAEDKDEYKATGSSAVSKYGQTIENEVKVGVGTPSKTVEDFVGSIIRVLQIIFVGLGIIMLIVLGVKFMVGSIEQKAEIKKHLVHYTVGAILLFSAAGIVEIIKNFVVGNFHK